MRRLLCAPFPSPGSSVELDEGEARHAIQVLRLRDGDEVELLDGEGHRLRAHLVLRKGHTLVENRGAPVESALRGEIVPLDLALGVLKGEAMEWALEKCVELGVRSVTPLQCDRSIVQTRSKGEDEFRDRWQRIADQALKQCGRLTRLRVERPAIFDETLFQDAGKKVFFADEAAASGSAAYLPAALPGALSASILIGPEGGWSERERAVFRVEEERAKDRVFRVSLGPLVLRAETAAVFAASTGRALLSRVN